MKFPNPLTWDWFVKVAQRRWPQSPAPPSDGCWEEAIAWLSGRHHLEEARSLLRKGTGERAVALYWAARNGLITERGPALLTLLRKAPGDRAWALYLAASDGLITERGPALLTLLRKAPGDRAIALYSAACDGLIAHDTRTKDA